MGDAWFVARSNGIVGETLSICNRCLRPHHPVEVHALYCFAYSQRMPVNTSPSHRISKISPGSIILVAQRELVASKRKPHHLILWTMPRAIACQVLPVCLLFLFDWIELVQAFQAVGCGRYCCRRFQTLDHPCMIRRVPSVAIASSWAKS